MSSRPIQPADRERLRRLAREATPGPWEGKNHQTHLGLHNSDAADHRIHAANGDWIAHVGYAKNRTANTELIAALRNHYEGMEAALEVAVEALESIRSLAGAPSPSSGRYANGMANEALRALGLLGEDSDG